MFCSLCKKQFGNPHDLCRHIRNYHKTLTPYRCYDKNCRQAFMKLFNYERHLKRFHASDTEIDISISRNFSDKCINNKDGDLSCKDLAPNQFSLINSFCNTRTSKREQFENDVLQYCSETCSKSSVPFSSIISSISSTSSFLQNTVNYLKSETEFFLTENGIKHENNTESLMATFDFAASSLSAFDSKYKIINAIKASGRFIEPKEIILGTRYEQKLIDGIPHQFLKNDTCQYISIAETMKKNISIDGFLHIFKTYKQSKSQRNAALSSIQDGFYYYSNLILSSMDTIVIELYIDDVELTNPLGSHTGVHKLGFVYFKIKDLPVHLQSSLDSIFITNIHYYLDVEKYGYQTILNELIQDLKKLSDEGIEFQGNTYKVAVWQVVGDNLGLNKLLGFVESFSANFCCRLCLAKKDILHKMVKEDISLLRNKVEHDMHVNKVCSGDITTSECGVRSPCCLNDLSYWHVTSNLVVDVMHDLFEGWCASETFLILHQFIFKAKIFTYGLLNDRIINFNYGKYESSSKPMPINREKVLNLDGSSGQSASQMWTLIRSIPLLIGDKITEDNEFWQLFNLMLKLIDTIMAPVITLPETYELAENIADHHRLFLELFPNKHLSPKMHFAVHYSRIIRQLGPPVRYWSMRYESKHYPSKRCASASKNFVNIAKTVATRHQLQTAHTLHEKYFKCNTISDVLGTSYGKMHSLKEHNLKLEINGLSENSEVMQCNSFCYNGTTYSKNMVVFVSCIDELLIFGKIKEMFVHNNNAFLICEMYESLGFDSHFHSYVVSSTGDVNLINIKDLFNYVPLHIRKSYDLNDTSMYITLRYKPCCTNEHFKIT